MIIARIWHYQIRIFYLIAFVFYLQFSQFANNQRQISLILQQSLLAQQSAAADISEIRLTLSELAENFTQHAATVHSDFLNLQQTILSLDDSLDSSLLELFTLQSQINLTLSLQRQDVQQILAESSLQNEYLQESKVVQLQIASDQLQFALSFDEFAENYTQFVDFLQPAVETLLTKFDELQAEQHQQLETISTNITQFSELVDANHLQFYQLLLEINETTLTGNNNLMPGGAFYQLVYSVNQTQAWLASHYLGSSSPLYTQQKSILEAIGDIDFKTKMNEAVSRITFDEQHGVDVLLDTCEYDPLGFGPINCEGSQVFRGSLDVVIFE